MKNQFIYLHSITFFFLILVSMNAQNNSGTVLESLEIDSRILNKKVNYSIYLPPNYNHSQRKYPIVYLLHGYTDDETGWIQFGEVQRIVDEGINNGSIPPMIIAMPDAGVSWYINNFDNSIRYEDFFINEFIPHIEMSYLVRPKKEFRGITGLSMGGYGSLLYAMKYAHLFAACAPMSAPIYTKEEVVSYDQERWDYVEGVLYGKNLVGEARITDHWKSYNPLFIAQQKGTEKLSEVKYYFDCADDDFLYKGNAAMHVLLRDLNVPHEFRVRDGAHNWTYWRTALPEVLAFIGESFRR